ncbi:unannotated protein [freshwater metagenome]|uniref:Unannotated protein n=1 Tax=freshwater metagenome TaxID=449393 RepID=A0A6J6EX54_9ZZZZ
MAHDTSSAKNVDREDFLPVVRACFHNAANRTDSGVVNQNVEPTAEDRCHLSHRGSDTSLAGHIAWDVGANSGKAALVEI